MTGNIPDIDITSFAAPTAEDITRFESLTDAQRRALIDREIQKGLDSGLSNRSMEDIWAEARRRLEAKAHEPDAL